MHSDRWKQVDEVLQSAQDRAPEEREAFVRHACAGDESLEREVRSLLAADPDAGQFLDRPAIEVAAQSVAREGAADSLAPGAKLGSYDIVGPLGVGGMGEVYRARDRRLERSAAIKILPPAFSADSERLRRFEQEARLASALNHPI